jgi:Tfp pilus assembly protein PilF
VSAFARDNWVSVRSKHLLVIGNGSEKDIRSMAVRLEQFREVVMQLFARPRSDSSVPTTVIVFKDDASYTPFKTNENNAGYFQPGQDVNYITLSAETRGEQDYFNIIFHEYTHLITNNSIGPSPAWFNEGLAELYSTVAITNNGVVLGRPIHRHITSLKQNAMLPLRLLFEVDYKSPYYNESHKQSIFYAESWALMHYLMLNRNGGRAQQTITFLELLRSHEPLEKAVQKAFSTTLENLEGDLQSYIQQDRYRLVEALLPAKTKPVLEMTAAPVSEAELQAYLGDLLVHSNRADAEIYLQKALQLDPQLTFAHASLGILRFRQGRMAEALPHLERAAATDSKNALVHYYYASALSRTTQGDANATIGYSPEDAARTRSELKKAIALRPDFADSYNLLAYVNLVTNTDIGETISLLKAALARSPNHIDFMYMLGQLYMHDDDYKQARPMLNQVVAGSVEVQIREHAQKLLSTMNLLEEQEAEKQATRVTRGLTAESEGAANQISSDPSISLREALRLPDTGESQVQGTLMSIDCDPVGLVFVVKTNDRILRLKTDSFQQVKRTTFTPDVKGTITCGTRKPVNAVVVCYLPTNDRRLKVDGTLKSIEFVPSDFHLIPDLSPKSKVESPKSKIIGRLWALDFRLWTLT